MPLLHLLAAGMAGNIAGAAGEIIGVGDALQGIGFGMDYATGAGLDAAGSAEGDIRFADTVIRAENAKNKVVRSVQGFADANPNTAEGMKAVVNAATAGYGAAAKGAGAAKTAGAGYDFTDVHRAERGQTSTVANSRVGIEWGKGISKQGMPWENYVGQSLPASARLPKNFKTFDYFDISSGKAISAKTLDTQTASRITNPKRVYNTMKRQVDAAARFDQHTLSGIELNSTMITQREVQIAVPSKTNAAQRAEIQRAVEYGKSHNVDVIVTEIK